MAFSTLKMVLLAAMPKASERMTTTRKPGFFSKLRVAYRTSAQRVSNRAGVLMFTLPPREMINPERLSSILNRLGPPIGDLNHNLYFCHTGGGVSKRNGFPRRLFLGPSDRKADSAT